MKNLLADDIKMASSSSVTKTPPPLHLVADILNDLKTCVSVENRSFLSLLSDNLDLAVRVNDLYQELQSHGIEVPLETLKQVDALRVLFE